MKHASGDSQDLAASVARHSFDPDEIVVQVSGQNVRIKWTFALARRWDERGKGGHWSAQNETGRYSCQYDLSSSRRHCAFPAFVRPTGKYGMDAKPGRADAAPGNQDFGIALGRSVD
jgi:hypothetical protein